MTDQLGSKQQKKIDDQVAVLGTPEVSEMELIPTLLELSDRIDEETGMPVVGGHTLSIPQWVAFCLWAERNVSIYETPFHMRKMGMDVSPNTVAGWRCHDWWKTLAGNFTAASQHALFKGLANRVPKMLAATEGILNGDKKYDKVGNAVVRLLQSFMEMGPKPLISRTGVTIDMSTTNQQFNLGEISSNDFKGLSAEDISMMARPDDDPSKKRRK